MLTGGSPGCNLFALHATLAFISHQSNCRWLITSSLGIVVLLQYCHTHVGYKLAHSVEHPSDLCWYGSYYPVGNSKELQGGLSLPYASVACLFRSPNLGLVNNISGGMPPELLADYEDSAVAFFFGRHGFFCIIRNPEDDENLLCLRVQNVTGKSIRRMHQVANPPRDFAAAASATRKDYRLYIVSDVVIPNHFALVLINADTYARFNTWSDLRLRYLPRTAVAELIQKATPFPKFVNNCYSFPWVNGVSIGPGHTAEIADGAYIYFHPYSLLGKAITLVDFERPFSLSRNRRVRRSVPFLTIAEPVPPLAILDIAPNRPITPRLINLNVENHPVPSHAAGTHPSDGEIDESNVTAGGKRALQPLQPPSFNFSTAVYVIGEEGHHGTLLLPGFASEEAIIFQVAAKIRPRFLFVHPITEAFPLPDELLFGSASTHISTRNCVCLVSTRAPDYAVFVLFNASPMHFGAPNPEHNTLRRVWLPGSFVNLAQICRACNIPAFIDGVPTLVFCNSDIVPQEGHQILQNGYFIFYTATSDHSPDAQRAATGPSIELPSRQLHRITSGASFSLSLYRSRIPTARFHFTPNFIYFPIGDAWRAVSANFWLYAMLLSLHFSCDAHPVLNADAMQQMLTSREYCRLISCSHYFARFIRLRAAKDPYWFFEFGRVYARAAGTPNVGDFSMLRIPQWPTAIINPAAYIPHPTPDSPLDLLVRFYHPFYKRTFVGTCLRAGQCHASDLHQKPLGWDPRKQFTAGSKTAPELHPTPKTRWCVVKRISPACSLSLLFELGQPGLLYDPCLKGDMLPHLNIRHQADRADSFVHVAPHRTIFPWPVAPKAEEGFASPHLHQAHLSGGGADDIPFLRQSAQIQHLDASQQCIRFPVFNLHCAIPRHKWFYYLLGSNHSLQNSDGDTTMFVCYLAGFVEIRGIAKLASLDLDLAFFIRNIVRNPIIWEPACYASQGFIAFSDFLASLPRFRIPDIQGHRAFPPPWVCSGPDEFAPALFFLPKGFAFVDEEGHNLPFSPWDPTTPNIPSDDDFALFLGIGSIGSALDQQHDGPLLLNPGSPAWRHEDASPNVDAILPHQDFSGGALEAAELGKLAQKIKNLLPHFQIQQIRAVLLTDNKAAAKLAKAAQDEALINIFSAAAKRLNMVPKQAPAPAAAPEPPVPTDDAPEEGWSVKGRGRSKSRNRSPSRAPDKTTTVLSSPDRRAKSANAPKRTLTPCADGWNIPVMTPSDMRYDQNGLCATDSAAFASQLWEKCKLSTKTIAVLAPKNLAVGHGEPRMMIVPFLEKRDSYPTRKIDMQVWLHQLTPNKATFAHERKITDLSAAKTKTLITRSRISRALIPAAHREDFARGYKPIMKLVLAEFLDDQSTLLIDVWSPKWNDNFQAFTCLMRFKEEDAEKVLSLSKPGSIIVDTPVELSNSFKHVWLRVDGENFTEDKVLDTLSGIRNFGAFEKKGTWAIRTLEQEFTALKTSLGIDANPSYVIRGLPSDYSETEVADFCKNIQWDVTVEATSRRFEFGRTRWLVRAAIPPTTNSTFCFTDFQRLRVTIDPTAQVRTALARTPVAFQDFQAESFDSPIKPKSKGKGKGKGSKTVPLPVTSLEPSIPAPVTPRPLSVPPPFVPIHTPERRPCLAEQRSRTPRVPNARVHFEEPPADKESYDILAQRLATTDAKLEQLTAILQNFAPAMQAAAASSNHAPIVARVEPTLSNPDAYPSHSNPDAYMAFEGSEFPTLDDSS